MNGHKIIPSNHIKYLGIYLDPTLSGKHHCESLLQKLKRANGMLSKIRHYVPIEELKSIYHAIFSSHMLYGSQIWGQGLNIHLDKICKLQNRALRIINFKNANEDVNQLYSECKILKLQDYIRLQNCLFVHDYLNNTLPNCFQGYYFKLNHMYYNIQTRNADLGCLFVPSKKTTKYGLHSITQKSINSWNSIAKFTKINLSNQTRYSLKKMLTKYFIDQYW